jgi:predicted deacylase
MRVEQLGEGDPEIAVVAAIHGDEPCGVRAVERLLDDEPPVREPVRLVVANEVALDRGVRYVDADLNRAFDEETDRDAHEYQLARALRAEIEGCRVLSIHSTQSHAEPFAVASGTGAFARAVCPALSVAAVVNSESIDEGRLFTVDADILEVEAGLQGTAEAAENAYRLVREFLTATGVLPGSKAVRELPVFELGEPIEKPPAEEYEVFVENFTPVEAGETVAAADGEPIIADGPFVPVLVSARGYEDVFGYAGRHTGTLAGDGALPVE